MRRVILAIAAIICVNAGLIGLAVGRHDSAAALNTKRANHQFETAREAQAIVPFDLLELPANNSEFRAIGSQVSTYPTLVYVESYYRTQDGRLVVVTMTNSKNHEFADDDAVLLPTDINGIPGVKMTARNIEGTALGVVSWKRGFVTVVVTAVDMSGDDVLPFAQALRKVGR